MVTLVPTPTNVHTQQRRVEILGVFGAGKTTLAKRLALDEVKVLAERHDQNPFWGDSFVNERLGYLAYDLAFLLQHVHLAATLVSPGPEDVFICDWSLASDWLWASMRLGSDLMPYEGVHRVLLDRLGPPIGYLYLRQPAEVILERLLKRGREPEAGFVDYIASVVTRLDEFVRSLPADRVVTAGDDAQPEELQAWVKRWREMRTNG